jgi:integrase
VDFMARGLTAIAVANAMPKATRREIPDPGCAGLYLVIQPSGKKSWAVRYRIHGRPKKLTLGPVASKEAPSDVPANGRALTLAAARKLTTAALHEVQKDIDPAQKKQIEMRRLRTQQVEAEHNTVAAIAARFLERHAKAHTRERSWREYRRIIEFDVLPRWGKRPICEIGSRDIHSLLDHIVDRGAPIVANRTLAVIRKMCAWAVERGALVHSPCAGIKPPSRAVSRDRVLNPDELRLVLRACNEIDWPFGPLVKLLIATAQRRDGVGSMTWTELDLQARTWLIPARRMKGNVAHEVPLSDYALEILGTVERIQDCPFVFSTTGKTAVDGYSRAKVRLNDKIVELMRADAERNGGDPESVRPVPHWTFHDLRRTAATHMAGLDIALPVIEKILAHTSGSLGGIVGVYQRYEFVAEKRAALEAWGKRLTALTANVPAKVITFRGAVQ